MGLDRFRVKLMSIEAGIATAITETGEKYEVKVNDIEAWSLVVGEWYYLHDCGRRQYISLA